MRLRALPAVRTLAAGTLTALLAACAGTGTQPAEAPVAVSGTAAANAAAQLAFPIAGAIPAAQATAVMDALFGDLARRLRPETTVGAVGVSRRADGAPRVLLDEAQAFEVGSAQMRPETLLRVAECAAAAQAAGAFVVHVIGYGEPALTPEIESLGERRATTVAAYLRSRGLSSTRLRAEGRTRRGRDAGHRLELVFEPIIEGREVRAWMPPAVIPAP